MRALDVSLPALPRAADGLLAFADELPPMTAPAVDDGVRAAVQEFCHDWGRALEHLSSEAVAAAADVVEAARTYATLERLLIGGRRR